MKKYMIICLVLFSFVLCSCEEALEAIEALDGPANCEASRDPINEINGSVDANISQIETTTTLTDEEKAIIIEDYNNQRQELINDANNEHCG